MNDTEIRRLVDSLDKEVPQDGAKVRFFQYGGGPDESAIHANKAGYLRLGIEFLKAAFSPQKKSDYPHSIEINLDYLCASESDVNFSSFERREDLKTTPYVQTLKDKIIGYCFLTMLIAGLIFAVIGLISVARWLF